MQGAIDVRFGSGAIEYCTEFGSKVTKDDSRAFAVRQVDTPVACGRVPVSCP